MAFTLPVFLQSLTVPVPLILSLFSLCAVAFNCLTQAIFSFNPLEYLFGAGSFAVRLVYVFGGVGAIYFILFAIIFKPFRTLGK